MFPVLAAFFTIPYAVYQYRKYGSLLVLRVVIVYSFILYMTCAYFLTMLPLPPIAEVARYTSSTMDLVPFHAWTNFWENTTLVLSDPSTYLKAMKEQCFYPAVGAPGRLPAVLFQAKLVAGHPHRFSGEPVL